MQFFVVLRMSEPGKRCQLFLNSQDASFFSCFHRQNCSGMQQQIVRTICCKGVLRMESIEYRGNGQKGLTSFHWPRSSCWPAVWHINVSLPGLYILPENVLNGLVLLLASENLFTIFTEPLTRQLATVWESVLLFLKGYRKFCCLFGEFINNRYNGKMLF